MGRSRWRKSGGVGRASHKQEHFLLSCRLPGGTFPLTRECVEDSEKTLEVWGHTYRVRVRQRASEKQGSWPSLPVHRTLIIGSSGQRQEKYLDHPVGVTNPVLCQKGWAGRTCSEPIATPGSFLDACPPWWAVAALISGLISQAFQEPTSTLQASSILSFPLFISQRP